MAVLKLQFQCGHDPMSIDVDKSGIACWCGEPRVRKAFDVPRPNVTGHASGPLVNSKHLGPIAVDLSAQPLTLKES